jgi:multidrug efflux system membrane fusion protein
MLGGGGQANSTPGEVENPGDDLFLVSTRMISAIDYVEQIQVRGRTEALKKVSLKAEVTGRVVATPVEKGQRVKTGQTICRIAPNAREANLAKARALATQRQLEYDASLELSKKGFRSGTQVAAAKAELDAAIAGVRQAEVELDNTLIKAPFAGLVNDRPAEVGDFLQVGGTCAILLTDDPYLVVGEVSDRQVNRIKQGQPAVVELTNGTIIESTVRYISSAARIETRTFRVEVEVPNPALELREGMTANILIPTNSAKAHFLTPSLLTLKDDGSVGIRIVEDGVVKFFPITIAGNNPDGLWVKGLPDQIQLIVTGQNFVTEGQKVRVSVEGEGDE